MGAGASMMGAVGLFYMKDFRIKEEVKPVFIKKMVGTDKIWHVCIDAGKNLSEIVVETNRKDIAEVVLNYLNSCDKT